MERVWLKSYEEGVPHDIDVDSCNSVVDIFEKSFSEYRDKDAFTVQGLPKMLKFGELDQLSGQFASYLQNELGFKKGDRVALMMPNILQYPIALFGILRAGMTVVNVNPLYTARELEHQLKDSGARAILILANFANTLEKVLEKTPVEQVIVTEVADMVPFPRNLIINFVVKNVKKMVPAWNIPSAVPFKTALRKGKSKPHQRVEIGPEDLAFLQYTGGTTGVSKGAMLTHRNISANVAQSRAWIGTDLEYGKEIIITPLPMYHIFSLTANCLVFCSIGALNVLIPNPRDMGGFIEELKKWKFTAFTGVNTLFNGLVNHPEFQNVGFQNLKVTLGGGMAVQRSVAEKWQSVTKTPLIEAYGLTETSPACCINPMTLKGYNGFIGLPISSTVVTIRDEEGNELPQGETGELCVSGPQVMKGYWNRPEETAKTFFDGGWLRTGDVAVMNEEGFFKIVDRMKDMILVSGFNVYPNEVEDVIATHPKVMEVAAVGVPDPKSTEAVKVFVVAKDKSLTEAEIKEFCKENLTGYKRPKFVEFRDDLPKSNVGKILRRKLRDS